MHRMEAPQRPHSCAGDAPNTIRTPPHQGERHLPEQRPVSRPNPAAFAAARTPVPGSKVRQRHHQDLHERLGGRTSAMSGISCRPTEPFALMRPSSPLQQRDRRREHEVRDVESHRPMTMRPCRTPSPGTTPPKSGPEQVVEQDIEPDHGTLKTENALISSVQNRSQFHPLELQRRRWWSIQQVVHLSKCTATTFGRSSDTFVFEGE